MKIYIDEELGVISGTTIDPLLQSTGQDAPQGVTLENYTDWILIKGKWVQDAEAAALARGEEASSGETDVLEALT